jgi:hypothetical protein
VKTGALHEFIVESAGPRHWLVPKLISDELRVGDAERFLKERGLC